MGLQVHVLMTSFGAEDQCCELPDSSQRSEAVQSGAAAEVAELSTLCYTFKKRSKEGRENMGNEPFTLASGSAPHFRTFLWTPGN